MIVISCSHGKHLGKLIAKPTKTKSFWGTKNPKGFLVKTGARHSELLTAKFPDDELLIRFNVNVQNQDIILIQSFYGKISDCIIEVILAASTAKEIGAKKVILVAPYFPYLRQDKRFHDGESVSQEIITELVERYFDEILIIDPHLHRSKSLEQIFKIKAIKLTANSLIADYIKKHIKNPVIIGPDEESWKWARSVSEIIGAESRILEKKRYSSYHVKVKLNKKIDLKGKNVVIVDDIISTGHTIIEAAKLLRKLGAKNIYCICVHGIFVNDTLKKLRKNRINIISTNTIPNKVARIDVSGVISNSL